MKPNVSHLQEFGAPVWVLLQGQKEQRKMLPKSKQCAYVSYDNGSKSVKYYNAKTCKVLISQNYHFVSLPEKDTLPEEIMVTPDMLHEGESGGSMLPMGNKDDSPKRKQVEMEELPEVDAPCKTHGI